MSVRIGSRLAEPGVSRRALVGAAIGWCALPILAVIGLSAGSEAGGGTLAIMLGGAVAVLAGLAVGVMGLGTTGIIGAVFGTAAAAVLPYLVIAAALGWFADGVAAVVQYLPGMVGATIAAGVAALLGDRLAYRLAFSPRVVLAVGVAMLAIWVAGWLVLGLSSRTA